MLESSDLDSTKRTNRWDRIGKNITRGQYLVYSRKYPSLLKQWIPWKAIVIHVSQASIIELWQLLNNIIPTRMCAWLWLVIVTSVKWNHFGNQHIMIKIELFKETIKNCTPIIFLKIPAFRSTTHLPYSLLYLNNIFSSSDKKTSLLEDNLVSCLW